MTPRIPFEARQDLPFLTLWFSRMARARLGELEFQRGKIESAQAAACVRFLRAAYCVPTYPTSTAPYRCPTCNGIEGATHDARMHHVKGVPQPELVGSPTLPHPAPIPPPRQYRVTYGDRSGELVTITNGYPSGYPHVAVRFADGSAGLYLRSNLREAHPMTHPSTPIAPEPAACHECGDCPSHGGRIACPEVIGCGGPQESCGLDGCQECGFHTT